MGKFKKKNKYVDFTACFSFAFFSFPFSLFHFSLPFFLFNFFYRSLSLLCHLFEVFVGLYGVCVFHLPV